jgi:hypothetical protein
MLHWVSRPENAAPFDAVAFGLPLNDGTTSLRTALDRERHDNRSFFRAQIDRATFVDT